MKTFKTYLFAVLLVFAVAGCSDDSEVSSEISNDTDETAEKLSLTQSLPADAVSLDPHGSNDSPSEKIRSHIYEGLVSQDENLDIVPELSSDGNK
jgi:ABC-type dipeptide transport system, periplasmic component